MAEFFKKKYVHAYKRGEIIWVQGQIQNQKYHRMSTSKVFSKANMNWVEKNWEVLLESYFEKQKSLADRSRKLSILELMPMALDAALETASEGTISNYQGTLKKHVMPVFGDLKPDEISVGVFKSFQKDLRVKSKLARKTILNVRAAFNSIYRYAVDEEIVDKNPILLVKAPASKLFIYFDEDGVAIDHRGNEIVDDINPFNLDDVWNLIDNAEGQFRNILTTLFFTGMRLGELITLKWDDIDWENGTIHIQRASKSDGKIGRPKNGKTRKIDILPPVMKALQKQFKDTGLNRGFIYLAQDGTRYSKYDTFRKYHWKNLLIRVGYDHRVLYQTRHTFASVMLQKGEELAWVSKVMLGHSELATTLRFYAKYIPDDSKKRAIFLDDERTNNVQDVNLKLESM
jgi:integrase